MRWYRDRRTPKWFRQPNRQLYAYINPEGKEVRVSYTADSRRFRVLSNDLSVAPVSNLVAPIDTLEVAQAKAEHAAAVTAARSRVAPVQDTAEVAAAKPEFAVKFAAAKDAATPQTVLSAKSLVSEQLHPHSRPRSRLPRRLKFKQYISCFIYSSPFPFLNFI